VAEIEAVAPDPEVDGDLEDRLGVLEHAEELAVAAARAATALASDGAGQQLGEALEALRRLPAADPALEAAHERVLAVTEEVRDLSADLRRRGDELGADPAQLEELRARRRALQELYRRYGADPQQVLDHAQTAAAELARLEAEEEGAGGLEDRVAQLERDVRTSADELHATRRAAADRLCAGIDARLGQLGMPHATFHVELARAEPARHGADRVRFELAPNPGEPPVSLERAASGGERSRVMLALEVTLADAEGATVLVFDEVDAGIGGETAMAVGETLARLAQVGEGRQVLCVTHLAQLAAFADVHHTVVKEVVGGRTVTRVQRVAAEDRVGELARMLGGDTGGDVGRDHARALMAEAHRRVAGPP
jgi:DNA repair protein RecN (Recombination protein N)